MPSKRRIYLKKPISTWGEEEIALGTTKNIKLTISESYSGMHVRIPIQIRRAEQEGPVVFITAALHGDEINGTGAIRQLLHSGDLDLIRGSLILVPVLNLLAFDRHSRYLPDRRDLNRFFPGSPEGSLASRMANNVFQEIVLRSDYGIDLHTAAVRKTNYPNIRADMRDANVGRIAKAFGCELILDGKGPDGSLRREASRAGCPTIILEGGEVWKVEPSIVDITINGIKNVLRELGMLEGSPSVVKHQTVISKSKWIRAMRGGFLQFHVTPGEIVAADQPIATNTNLLGVEKSTLYAPFDGIIIGMTTLPAVTPGESVVNIGRLEGPTQLQSILEGRTANERTEEKLVDDLATNITTVQKQE
ncbi:MAG: succinylglutamate desuccinylase/aspartoacylase family protein [Planctomycetales bacterium]|nr:succinylglutamate desuccinylase/aspartoacylase family protein [Planctomycetales bacterium]